jgi:hypothetical protein
MIHRPPRGGEHPRKFRSHGSRYTSSMTSAEETLRRVLAREEVEADVSLVAVNTDEEARRFAFPGSPTIRVDGEDLFPLPDRTEYALGCRMYATAEGLKGSPTAMMLRAALAERDLVPEVS